MKSLFERLKKLQLEDGDILWIEGHLPVERRIVLRDHLQKKYPNVTILITQPGEVTKIEVTKASKLITIKKS
jgi:hypothetical protein